MFDAPILAPGERTVERMGWRPDPFDIKDFKYSEKLTNELAQFVEPTEAILTKRIKKVPKFDQLTAGSCVGASVAAMMAAERGVSMRSVLQIYYEARRIIGETGVDLGAYIRDGVKVIATLGAGRQSWWPYDLKNLFVDPIEKVDRDGLKRRIFTYYRLENREDYISCLQQGHTFVIGFTCYSGIFSRRTAATGLVAWPRASESMVGGHAVLIWGYDPNFKNTEWAARARAAGFPEHMIPERVYYGRNSWGLWGNQGDFAIDANYLEHPYLADDAWTIRK